MPSVSEAIEPWHGFFALLGEASATMVGLLFVAASVSSGVFSIERRAALRVFLSASVVHFSSILAACLIVTAPQRSWVVLGLMVLGVGVFGLAYSGVAWRDTARDGLRARIDREDHIWYLLLPVVGYVCECASAIVLALRLDWGCVALALSVGMLMVVAIHNAWDITVWTVARRRE